MKYLITGATGLLGNNLVRYLISQGHQVGVLLRPPLARVELDGLNIELIESSLDQSDRIRVALENVDVVVHVAALIHIGRTRFEESRKVNVESTRLIASLANELGVKMIHISTVDALAAGTKNKPATELDIEPLKVECAYVVSKREADAALFAEVKKGLHGVAIHPGLMFGAWDWKPSSGQMILALAKRFVPFGPRGGISAVDVEDVVKGIMAASIKGKSGERYLMTGHNLPYIELWRIIAKLLDRPGPWMRIGPANAWGAGKIGDLMSAIRGREGEVNSASIQLSNLYHYYDSAKAIEELDYSISELEPCLLRAIEFLRGTGENQVAPIGEA